MDAGIFEFPAALGLTHENARLRVSDHAPVHVTLEGAQREAPSPTPRAAADAVP